jgi:hypothetical protein
MVVITEQPPAIAGTSAAVHLVWGQAPTSVRAT